ncbi:MAG: aldehyde ferredoxin oxidoreductase family protein [Anaerolineae bacterium]
MLHGYTGKILHVDLTSGTFEVETPPEAFYKIYIGGSALGLYYLFKFTEPGVDPLGPDNVLTLALSAPTGLSISGQSRCTAVAKSPLTGAVGDSQAGGFWPAELKFAGFDAVVIRGKSPKPVYLWVHDGEYELRDAGHLWGLKTGEAEAGIKDELGDSKIEVAQIGPAGEKLVRFAAIINMSNRAFGRTGMGAVMGSKNLKAIAVRGRQRPTAFDSAALMDRTKSGAKSLPGSDMESFGRYGTAGIVAYQNASGGLPTFNYRTGVFDGSENITGEKLYDELLRGAAEDKQDKLGRDTCYACIVRCKRVVEAEWRERPVEKRYGGPEYETIATFGSYCGIDDLPAVSLANQMCNQYGVDTISAGATLSFAMECFEEEIISPEDTDGIELRFGNAEAMLTMLEKTLNREGFGDVLAEGSRLAAEKIGRGAEDYAMTVKGNELPAHMPQVKKSLALIYAVNPFGADHQSSEHDTGYTPRSGEQSLGWLASIGLTDPQNKYAMNEEKVRFALRTQMIYSFMDSAALCQFVFGPSWQLYGPEDTLATWNAVTGWDFSMDDLLAAGERRLNLLRAFNAREGIARESDTLPKRLFKPLEGGRSDGKAVTEEEFEFGLRTYYQQAGWSEDGLPTRQKLESLQLAWVADEIGV